MAAIELSTEDQEFLAKCEEELKDRFTDKDEEFMKVFNAEPSTPPIMDPWWVQQNSGRRNDRRYNRRNLPYERSGRDHRDNDRRGHSDRRGYGDSERDRESYDHRGYQRHQRPRY